MASRTIMTGLLVALAAASAGAVPVDVCVEPSFESAVAVMRLDERSPTLDLRPVRPSGCADGDGYRARFQGRAGRVLLVLWTPAGERLERSVPWATRPDDAIIDLSRQGRLGAVAVLLDGLVLEDRAVQLAAPRSRPLAGAPVVVAIPTGAGIDAPPPSPALEVSAPGVVESVIAPKRRPMPAPPARRYSPKPTPDASPIAATTAARALARASPGAIPPTRPPPQPEPAPQLDPVRPADSPSGGVAAETRRSPSVAPAPAVVGPPGAAPRLGARMGAALRSPTVLGFEAAIRVEAWELLLEVGGMPPVVWALDGRPLQLGASWAEFGWLPPIWSGADVDVHGQLALVVERLTVLRLEYPDAVTRAVWDAGLDLAVVISGPMGDGWRIGGVLGARWLATANDVRIPEGPRAALNAWQSRLALVVDWAP